MSARKKEDKAELDRPAGHVVGDGLVRLFFGLLSLGLVGFGAWMWGMYETQQDLASKSMELAIKLDVLNAQLAEAKTAGKDASAVARDNARRLDRIEATRFTDQDALKVIAPLEHRIERIESGRRR